MLTSNSVVTPKTRTAVDDNNNSETTNTDLGEDTPETATTTTTTNAIQQDDPLETAKHIAEEVARETTANISEEPRDTATNVSEEPHETTTNISEESGESDTKSHDQKDGTVYGDNPGNLPEDAIANESGNIVKNEVSAANDVSTGNEVAAGVDNDQKTDKSEKDAQSGQISEGDQKGGEENNIVTQDEKEKPNTKQNAVPKNENMRENPEEGMSGDQQSFDIPKDKNNDDEANVQQLREDKGEVVDKEQKKKGAR